MIIQCSLLKISLSKAYHRVSLRKEVEVDEKVRITCRYSKYIPLAKIDRLIWQGVNVSQAVKSASDLDFQ